MVRVRERVAALRDGGILVSDDVNSTAAFPEFAREQRREPIALGRGMAFLVKCQRASRRRAPIARRSAGR